MKTLKRFIRELNVHTLVIGVLSVVMLASCGDDTVDVTPTGNQKSYPLNATPGSGVSGDATFIEFSDGSIELRIALNGTQSGDSHPAHIHFNTAAEGGAIAVSLSPIDGATGNSVTTFTALDDGTAISYTEILSFDGYINVHLSAADLSTIVADGDIGQNELTGESISYDLVEAEVAGINGTATFSERVNGEALAVIQLNNTPAGGSHPAHIHANSVAVGGPILYTFNPVVGSTGLSRSNLAMLDDGTPIGYADIASIDGYINVHLSMDDLATIVAEGNIGINEGEPAETSFDVTNSGASAYVFNGGGFDDDSNPDLTLRRGRTYIFNVTASGHPFFIKTAQVTGSSDTYDSGVTNNGLESGALTFVVPADAPDELFYICEIHASMTGTITVTD